MEVDIDLKLPIPLPPNDADENELPPPLARLRELRPQLQSSVYNCAAQLQRVYCTRVAQQTAAGQDPWFLAGWPRVWKRTPEGRRASQYSPTKATQHEKGDDSCVPRERRYDQKLNGCDGQTKTIFLRMVKTARRLCGARLQVYEGTGGGTRQLYRNAGQEALKREVLRLLACPLLPWKATILTLLAFSQGKQKANSSGPPAKGVITRSLDDATSTLIYIPPPPPPRQMHLG
ncbi:hypothetical protein U0070_008851 [Myodes glareolus]|uniref:Uncharacterized protein n=1 Tax=Myodes glareolus TaxID=447135 RepID=A0AAW0IK14_MYOGA